MELILFILWLAGVALSIAVAISIIVGAGALSRMSVVFKNHLEGDKGSVVSAGTVPAEAPDQPHRLRITNSSNAPVYKVILVSGAAFRSTMPNGTSRTFNREDSILPVKHISSLLPGQSIEFPIGLITPAEAGAGEVTDSFEVSALLDYLKTPNALKGAPSHVLLGTDHLKHARA